MSSAVALKKEPAGVSAAGMSAPAPSPASAPALGASDLAGTAAAASPADYSQWAAAAAMQSYYAGANKTPVAAAAAAANGTQAAAYYAQMAQNPSLYAQMWNPVRAPTRPIERSRENRDSPRHVVRPARRHFADIFSHPSVSLTRRLPSPTPPPIPRRADHREQSFPRRERRVSLPQPLRHIVRHRDHRRQGGGKTGGGGGGKEAPPPSGPRRMREAETRRLSRTNAS